MHNTFTSIFKKGSKTYFYSSLFFPKDIQKDVFILYSFVRVADNFVDAVPQQKKDFYAFVTSYKQALQGKDIDNEVITAFVALAKRKKFDQKWITAFLSAMESDLHKNRYDSLAETEAYMYGSAEVIGLMMAAIMQLPKASYPAAQKLGKAMQYINFIRDIQEDNELGRIYLPYKEVKKAGLRGLRYEDAQQNADAFRGFIREQIERYIHWQKEAEEGFSFIPKRYRVAIKTASDMYHYTALKIQADPFIVYKQKVKPSKYQIVQAGLKNAYTIALQGAKR